MEGESSSGVCTSVQQAPSKTNGRAHAAVIAPVCPQAQADITASFCTCCLFSRSYSQTWDLETALRLRCWLQHFTLRTGVAVTHLVLPDTVCRLKTHREENLTQYGTSQQSFFSTSLKFLLSTLVITALILSPFCLIRSAGYLTVFKELNYRKQFNALETGLGPRCIIIYNFS